MGGWTPEAPWKPIPGSGQSKSLTSASAGSFTNKMGAQTRAFAFALSPAATPYVATVTVTNAATAATASTDYPVVSNAQTAVIGCSPGDTVSVYQASGSTQTAYLCEVTH